MFWPRAFFPPRICTCLFNRLSRCRKLPSFWITGGLSYRKPRVKKMEETPNSSFSPGKILYRNQKHHLGFSWVLMPMLWFQSQISSLQRWPCVENASWWIALANCRRSAELEQQTLLSMNPASETASKELGNSSPDAAACLAYFSSSFFTFLYFFSSSHHQKPLASVFRHFFLVVLSARSAQRCSLFLGLCFSFAWQEPANSE